MGLEKKDTRKYLSIFGDGTIRMSVPEGTKDALKRDYETKDGKKGTKYELIYNSLSGKITDIGFFEGDYGKTLNISIQDGDDEFVLSLPTNSSFGEDIMKKLPNLNMVLDTKFVPYSFEDDNGRLKKGVTLYQKDNKIPNFFYDSENKKTINGYPEPDKDANYDTDDWKMYYIQARKFLMEYINNNVIPNVGKTPAQEKKNDYDIDVEETINPEDIPF